MLPLKLVLSLRKLDLEGSLGHVQLLAAAACELFQSRHSRASAAQLIAARIKQKHHHA